MSESAQDEAARLRGELELANRKLAEAQKMALLGRLSAGVVHEINTPIGSIFSNNEVILRSLDKLNRQLTEARDGSAPVPAGALDIVATISALTAVDKIACERISSVVRSLKSFARVSQNDLLKADVNEMLRNTIKLAGTVFRRRIEFVTEFGDLTEIECYPGLLNQVFLNLIVNAGQAIDDEGRITVRTEQGDGFVEISIADNGKGIPPELRPRIFAAGFTTKPLGEGTGLGLTISREIIEDTHGGSIRFETETGKGTTFYLRIPISQNARSNSHWQTARKADSHT